MKKKAIIALSGGVDSAVSAYLLKKQGYEVIALYMKNWEDCPQKEYEDVVAICSHLNIPYYTVNFTQEYQDQVFSHFLEEHKKGRTPNPDILCNREIKFKVLLDKALQLGDFLATGHYCQIRQNTLRRAVDKNKDQSYFLYTLKKELFPQILFPIGHLKKEEVRLIAKEAGIPVYNKKDSTGICFIGERKFSTFLSGFLGFQPGSFENSQGKILGKHRGMAYYTIGQRKGIGIGGEGEAWYVVGKDPKRNVVLIEQGENHPSLYKDTLIATEITWVHSIPPSSLTCSAKIRYRTPDAPCSLEPLDATTYRVQFFQPQRAITPGQSVVFYQGGTLLGGGIIL